MAGPIVAVVSVKGGAGKTSILAAMAAELAHRGEKVHLVDADAQGSLAAWHAIGGPLSSLPIAVDPSEKAAQKALEAARKGLVLVDTGGAATRTLVAVLEVADIILIPCRPSGLDASRAQQALSLIDTVNQARRRKARAVVVLNSCTRSAMLGHIRSELESSGVTVLRSEIGQRTAFAESFLHGSAPVHMGRPAAKAAAEIEAMVNELMSIG